ncbi:PilZ domain-containing protein [Aliiglaciecola sp. 2_MG-2023]|uniref:PilZ domain-containing protein n=1 Tax=Alteromonadaceae TaxID=72275 RepID=UPI0026E1A74E|nr:MULTISPECIES: PilZ domain-containing protein [unclassified Aliiglaciecola]MDO6712319.1 PilZ domain-containing protein [Aliiglaciecola sp. 2_MG-2023]MDO6753275.1 PilZ domain-containing protein [Aliiglaciecola sp. 1_MG-2023]
MDPISLEQKMAQFHEFFTIKHQLSVNMTPVNDGFQLPSLDELVSQMPYAFKIAAEMSNIDTQALRPLRNLSEHAKDLTDFLNHQNKKLDLMMSYILQQQDDPQHRYVSVEFGGGGIILKRNAPLAEGTLVELKIFLTEESAAVYCYSEVIKAEPVGDDYHIYLLFSRIREEDQELLVRASLHMQTLQLRARSKQQNNDSN